VTCLPAALRRAAKAQLSRDHELIYPPVQEFWDAAVGGTS